MHRSLQRSVPFLLAWLVLLVLPAGGCSDGEPAHHHADHDHADHAGHSGGPGAGPGPTGARVEGGAPVMGTLPDFSLLDQDGEPFTRERLTGTLAVSDFIFTTCPDFCPLLTREMRALQEALASDPSLGSVRLVSFSVDPETDTPEALTRYAELHDADTGRWSFVTGPRPALVALIEGGFKLPVVENPDASGSPFLHSDRFVVTDAQGRIRGYYPALDEGVRERILADLRTLTAAR